MTKKIVVNSKEGAILYIPSDGITCRFDHNESKKLFGWMPGEDNHCELVHINITNKCDLNCFIAGTKILTSNGEMNIEDVNKNDIVYSYNEKNRIRVENQVKNLFKRKHDGEIIKITLDNGNEISVTPEHEIHTRNRGWVQAKDLSTDDDLFIF